MSSTNLASEDPKPKTPNRATVEELPALFSMVSHCGFCGVLFGSIWFLGATIFVANNLWKNGGVSLGVAFGAAIVSFFLAAWLGAMFATWNPISRLAPEWVRNALSGLTFLCVFGMCLLIWLTGGAFSPFATFYIMTFTLTLGNAKTLTTKSWVLIYFLIAILAACIIYKLFDSAIADADLVLIGKSPFQYIIFSCFIVASLIVPFESERRIQKKARDVA